MNAVTKTEPQDTLLPADPYVSLIEKVAMDPNSDIDKLERMLDLKRQHEETAAKGMFAAAFALASASFPSIPLNGKGHNGKAYATLKDIIAKTRPVLSEHGLALTFAIDTTDQITVTAKLMHKGGHAETTSIRLPSDTSGSKNAVQAVGSTQTYGQRYTAQAILGLSLGDDTEDDGRMAGGPVNPPQPQKRYSWADTVCQDLPEGATPRDKAMAVAQALCAQWKRMKGERQISNEWDRRAAIIESLEEKHPDLHETVCDGYEIRIEEIKEAAK